MSIEPIISRINPAIYPTHPYLKAFVILKNHNNIPKTITTSETLLNTIPIVVIIVANLIPPLYFFKTGYTFNKTQKEILL